MTSHVGQQLGNYRLTQLVGAGGFAEVYVGEHLHLGTQAAIKVLHTQLGDASAIEGFRKEARIIAQLAHPNIVRVLEFGVEQTVPFLVMDYAPHGSLSQTYGKGQIVPLDTIVLQVKQIATALQHAHMHKIIHRDIKPANMLIGRQNEILVSDFGIAVVSQSSHHQTEQDMAGTIAYMAPEQIQAHARPASDQYSLAIMVYEGLCGRRPFEGTFTEVAVKQITIQPAALHTMISISPVVEQVVFRALAKDASQRFSQVSEFAQALEYAAYQSDASYATRSAMYTDAVTLRPGQSYPTLINPIQRAYPAPPAGQGYPNQATPFTITPPMQYGYPAPQALRGSEQQEHQPISTSTLTPLLAPLYPRTEQSAQVPTAYAGPSIPSFLLVGVYVLLMLSSMSPIFASDTFVAMQTFVNATQPSTAPFSYSIWLNLTLPLEILLAGPVLGSRRGFIAVAITLTFYAVLEIVFFRSLINLLQFIGFLLTPLFVGWLYNSRKADGCLKVGVRFLLGAVLMLAVYRLIHHLIYIHTPVSIFPIILGIFLYGFGAAALAFVTTLLERLIRFFMEQVIKGLTRKNMSM